MTKEYVGYIPGDGHWPLPSRVSSLKEARVALLDMLGLKRMPAGAFVAEVDPKDRVKPLPKELPQHAMNPQSKRFAPA